MTLSFASATGNLFNRIGKVANLLKELDAYQAAQLINITDTTNGVVAQYDSESDIQAIAGSGYIPQLNSPGSIGNYAQQIANATLNRMIFRDIPLQGLTLTSRNTPACMRELLLQMNTAGASVLAMTVTGTGNVFLSPPNAGNGAVVVSVRRPGDGRVLENAFAETITFTCTADSYSGGAQPGNELFLVQGQSQQISYFAFDFPLGSGARTNISAIDGRQDNNAGNLLTNSGFEDWTDGIPDKYTLTVGAAGTNINQEFTLTYDAPPNTALRLTGDAAGTETSFQQQFSSSSGTQGILLARSQFAFNVFVRRDAVIPGAGILTIDLIDDNDVVIQDIAGVANSFTIDLTQLTTLYASYTGVFRTPLALPSTYYIRYRLSTPLTDGRSVYIDRAGLGSMQQLYASGPYVALFSGSDNFVLGDRTTAVITNSRGAGGTLSTWQTAWSRLFPLMISQGYLLPSSSVPTISDALIG